MLIWGSVITFDMDRKKFIKTGCSLCVGSMAGFSALSLLESCATGKIVKTEAVNNRLFVDKSSFSQGQSFVIVRASQLNYDVLLNQVEESKYTAVLLQCTHYDNPVYANNKEIFCPSHGSKFDFSGKVLKEPATVSLKSYRTEINNNQITIFLS